MARSSELNPLKEQFRNVFLFFLSGVVVINDGGISWSIVKNSKMVLLKNKQRINLLVYFLVTLAVLIVTFTLLISEQSAKGNRVKPEYNCSDSIIVDIDHVIAMLRDIKEKRFDLVVLNLTVNLDCLLEVDFRSTRIFLMNSRGQHIIHYYMNSDLLPFWLFGLNYTVLNVPVISSTENETIYTPGTIHWRT